MKPTPIGDFMLDPKTGMLSQPTPEEKCLHIGTYTATVCVRCNLVLKMQHDSPSPEARCKGCGTVGCTMHNDETEARVDWEKEAREIVECYPDFGGHVKPNAIRDIAEALSAAFEKGREAR
jgi:hypothetical protein